VQSIGHASSLARKVAAGRGAGSGLQLCGREPAAVLAKPTFSMRPSLARCVLDDGGMTSSRVMFFVLAACGTDDAELEPMPTCAGFEVAPDGPPELEIMVRDVEGNTRVASDMEPVDLMLPPQGGKVMLVAPRVRNMNACSLWVTASLRDNCSGRILGLEARPLRFAPTADGWAEPINPDLVSNWSNVPACPTAAAERDVEGEPYELTITVEDANGISVSASRRIVPTCAEAENLERCLCECDANYRLGETCAPDDDHDVTEGCS
jgi:hypothetical protein